jgi:hypothetical protein
VGFWGFGNDFLALAGEIHFKLNEPSFQAHHVDNVLIVEIHDLS